MASRERSAMAIGDMTEEGGKGYLQIASIISEGAVSVPKTFMRNGEMTGRCERDVLVY